MTLDVVIEDARWEAAGLPALAERAWAGLQSRFALDAGHEAVLLGCDDARIARLNGDFRSKPASTNVLSWPSEERDPGGLPAAPAELGDIAIAFETCAREAEAQGKTLDDHVTHLLVHGLLHLLGYDHECEADATVMEGLEVEILESLGVSDPY